MSQDSDVVSLKNFEIWRNLASANICMALNRKEKSILKDSAWHNKTPTGFQPLGVILQPVFLLWWWRRSFVVLCFWLCFRAGWVKTAILNYPFILIEALGHYLAVTFPGSNLLWRLLLVVLSLFFNACYSHQYGCLVDIAEEVLLFCVTQFY